MNAENKKLEQIIADLKTQGILEAIGDGITIQDTDFRIVYQNSFHKSLIGDHTGEYCYKAYEQREEICEGCPVFLAFQDGKTHRTERSIHSDKGISSVEITASPIRDATGKIIAGIEVVRDISERKKTEEALTESETRFRRLTQEFQALLDAIPDNLTLQSPDLKVLWANRGAAAGLGKEVSDLIEHHCYALWHNSAAPCEPCPVKRSFQTGNPENEIVSTPDGRTWKLRTVPIKDEHGRVMNVVEVGSDITELKKTQEGLQQERDTAHRYLDVAGVMLLVIDRDKKVSLVNKKGCEILGYREDEIIGKDWFENFIPSHRRSEISSVFEMLMAGKIDPVEYYENPVLTNQGEEKIIAWHNVVLRDGEGSITGTLSSGEDVTERRKMENEIKDRVKELENFYEMAIGRELRMKELKEEIKRLKDELARHLK